MRGSIIPRQRKRGLVYAAVYRDRSGRQRWRTFTRRRDAEAFLAREAAERDADVSGVPVALPGKEWIAAYLADLEDRQARGTIKPSTVASYRSVIKTHIEPTFGALRSDRITHRDVAAWMRELARELDAGRMAAKTHNNVLAVWSALIAWSQHPARRHVVAHLARLTERARVAKCERHFLEPHEIRELLEAADGAARLALHLAVYAGLRRNEIAALRPEDVDHERRQIRIARGISAGKLSTPKTLTSARVVDITTETSEAIRAHAAASPGSPWLFPSPSDPSAPMHPDTLSALVLPAFEAVGTPVRLHGLRHTYASLLIAQGETPKYVSAQMGHASIHITMDLYGHLFRQTREAAMARLAAQMAPPTPTAESSHPPARPAFRLIRGSGS